MFNLGFGEMLILAAIALIFIGPKELPSVAKVLGRVLGELKKAMSELSETTTRRIHDDIDLTNDAIKKPNVLPDSPQTKKENDEG